MGYETIRFPNLPWEPGAHPNERKKAARAGGATLLEFGPDFRDPNWCENGHAGFVIEGRLGLEFRGRSEVIDSGEAFLVDPGTPHRAYNPGPGRVLLFVAPRG